MPGTSPSAHRILPPTTRPAAHQTGSSLDYQRMPTQTGAVPDPDPTIVALRLSLRTRFLVQYPQLSSIGNIRADLASATGLSWDSPLPSPVWHIKNAPIMPQLLSIRHICLQLDVRHEKDGWNRTGLKPLSHLCQTSKAIHHISTPVLYAGFDGGDSDLQRSINFLRTISLRPELGELVQELRVLGFRSRVLDQSQKDVVQKAAARLGEGIPAWLELCPFEAVACLLIAQTPNLKALDIFLFRDAYVNKDFRPFSIFEDASAPVPWRASLPHLRQLSLGHGRNFSLDYFAGILQLTTGLTDLTLWSHLLKLPKTGLQCSSLMSFRSVTRLAVKDSLWIRSQLQSVVSRCLALERFHYQSRQGVRGDQVPGALRPRDLINMLRQYNHNNTLRSLYIDFEDPGYYMHYMDEDSLPIIWPDVTSVVESIAKFPFLKEKTNCEINSGIAMGNNIHSLESFQELPFEPEAGRLVPTTKA
ncbi:hypothetical protein CCMA1212_002627 [Trichoderma ghanense]|uniref:F-box domain-containing protein n=1 Tax=Trichoderma ghanense TaxID=65468 RepID=A0ABY2HB89_9HYPO